MSDYYVDQTNGSDSNGGTSFDSDAWATIAHAIATVSGAHNIWVRRGHNETPSGSIMPSGSSMAGLFRIIGWPRGAVAGTATFTHGSTTVSNVSISASREAHCGRFMKCDADGRLYLITRVSDSNTFIIDRPYVGSNASSANFTISEDELYSARPSAPRTLWDADAHTLGKIDFSGTAYYYGSACGDHFSGLFYMELIGGTGYTISIANGREKFLQGVLIKGSANSSIVYIQRCAWFHRFIIEGSGSGAAQYGVNYGGDTFFTAGAIYNCGSNGCRGSNGRMLLDNVNIGVEQANGASDIYLYRQCHGIGTRDVRGRDVKLGGTNGYVSVYAGRPQNIFIENYQKTLDRHYSLVDFGTLEKVAAGDGTPIPDQRSGGAESLIQVSPNTAFASTVQMPILAKPRPIFEHVFEMPAESKSYRYYVQTSISGGLSASELWLEAEYVDQYDAANEYHITTITSDEAISVRSGITDWSQYLEVTGIQPATASKVIIRAFINKADNTNKIWIDPKVVIS